METTVHKGLLPGWGRHFRQITAACICIIALAGCKKEFENMGPGAETPGTETDREAAMGWTRVNLVANRDGMGAAHVDPSLQNPWGLQFRADRSAWINAREKGMTNVYDERGNTLRRPITIGDGELPTAIVANYTGSFPVPGSRTSSEYIVAGKSGRIFAWNDATASAQLVVDRSREGAGYTGLEIIKTGGGHFMLLAADFKNNRIDMFDEAFRYISRHAFTDPIVPTGFSPYNIKAVDGEIFVTCASPDGTGEALIGRGLGLISVYRADGSFVRRFPTHDALDAPWGMETHGIYLLVANHGNGRINLFERSTGRFIRTLMNEQGQPVVIEGLRAIAKNNGDNSQLFFTASPTEGAGIFGCLKRAETDLTTEPRG